MNTEGLALSILLKNITKTFGSIVKTNVLQDINIKISDNQFISVLGPSGSGKSTLLSLIGTIETPSSGTILINDIDTIELNLDEIADLRYENFGFVFQQYHLIDSLTALENVIIPTLTRKVEYEREKNAFELLELVGLKDQKDLYPFQLSGGQQQRVAIARALITKPKWILADEPTGNLDSKNGELIFNLLKKIQQEENCGIIMVTHDTTLAERTDQIIEMNDGRIQLVRRGKNGSLPITHI
ncbi:lipoprotein-releasing system ATP-binding protein LolD (plasmid) [Cytobacillus kochii]|uniref:Lipoprotein-releasing system ATP-binding protein LolD n=1 Tax=Cytobacillus kochii TaxID=859143 RepID=A0A248TPV7_9BACI|nr:lipoprotein-releasing system ATP-binding protein LolD [Cytobacillus kochii]